jgi:hypothetical protein
MVEIPADADVSQLSKGDAKHGNDEDVTMNIIGDVPPIPEGEATA